MSPGVVSGLRVPDNLHDSLGWTREIVAAGPEMPQAVPRQHG
jgi:hypothetical protein